MGQVRARQLHEKEARRQEILRTATALWERHSFTGITMAQVAGAAGLAKGTLYLYFRTKEELFLALAEEELLAWFEELDEQLGRGREELEPATLGTMVAATLEARPRLPRLLAILHTVLEHNIDHLTALRFKQFLATRTLRTGRLLERRLPRAVEGRGALLLLRIHALVLGLWQLADPAPAVRALLDAPGLQLFRVAFGPTLAAAIADLLLGMVSPRSDSAG